jgi:hypothetical protein
MGCGSSSAVEVAEDDQTPNEEHSASAVKEALPGSPQAVAAAASKLRSEVEASSVEEKRRLQTQLSSHEHSEQQKAEAELRLREMEAALAQLLNIIESQKRSGASDEAAFEVHVPPPGRLDGQATPDDPAAVARDSVPPAALPVALSDDDALALKAALARCDDEVAHQPALAAPRPVNGVKETPSQAHSGLPRSDSVQSTQSTLSTQSDETIGSSNFGSLDPDVVSSSSLLRLNGILKRLDALELQAAFDANGGDAWQDEYDEG